MKRIWTLLLCAALFMGTACAKAEIFIEVNGERMSRVEANRTYARLRFEGREEEALVIIRELALAGDAQAMYELGMANVAEEKQYWLEYAAMAGSVEAMFALYEEYCYISEEVAMNYLRQAAQAGHVRAQSTLGEMLLWGDISMGVEQDQAEARRLLDRAALERDTAALYYVGYGKEKGQYGYAKNDREAAAHYRLLWEHGDPACWQYGAGVERLGTMYETGRGVQADQVLAFELYQEASGSLMDCSAHLRLARMHAEGRGTKQDTDAAWEILDSLREEAYGYEGDWAYLMGLMYQNGYGVQKNERFADVYFEQAQDLGVLLW